MNINVLVVNVPRDAWHSGTRASSRPEARGAVEEVIELLPQNGAWVGTQESAFARGRALTVAMQEPGSVLPPSRVTTYNHKGKVLRAPSEKGRYVNITA